MTVAGTPVNMPTHAHSQGYSDINFLIPELVAGVQYSKGPYFADQGDFATAGASNINYATTLDRPIVRVEGGTYDFGRVLMAASPKVRQGEPAGGIRDVDQLRPVDAFPTPTGSSTACCATARATTSTGSRSRSWGTTAKWNATEASPQRAIDVGPDRPVRIGRSDRRRTHLSLQRRRRVAARHRQHADQDSGVRARLRPGPDLELHVLPRRSGARRPARAGRSSIRHRRAGVPEAPDAMGRPRRRRTRSASSSATTT